MLTRGSGAGEILERLENAALPFLLEPAPDALLICAGYDALDPDPLASMTLTPADFREAMALVLAVRGNYFGTISYLVRAACRYLPNG